MSNTKTKMVRFNVKNVKYAVKSNLNVYGAVSELAYANSLTLESDASETKIYGDGIVIGVLMSDRGKTGTLSVLNLEDHYETDCGRVKEINTGIADVQQIKVVEHAIYYEVEAIKAGTKITIKNWLLGCITGKAGESYAQSQDEPTINYFDYPLTVMGDFLQNTAGNANYEDANGNNVKVYRITKYPTDDGYSTFGNEVPTPKALGG